MQFDFGDRLRIGVVFLTFIGYLVVAVATYAIFFVLWMPSGYSAQLLSVMAETAPPVLTGELLSGAIWGIAAGWLVCHLSGAKGLRNCLALGLLLLVYAIVGVFLHPAAPLWKHAVHLISPIPVTFAGGLLRLATVTDPQTGQVGT